jgi:serine/threonine-protein kinase
VRFCLNCGQDLAGLSAEHGDPYLGLVLQDKYTIEQLIGEGAMGRVYKARQTTLRKHFAVKILAPHLMNDEASHARFAAEAHNCASLNHPNVVSVVDYGTSPGGATYIVMEFIKGSALEDIIATEFPLGRDRIVDLTLQILAALAEAHGLGILHRDLKPENILVQSLRTHGELAKVLDFGIAKLMDRPDNDDRPGLTKAGMVCGTPEYMSPEQARGRQLDARSDLYAVGAILYQMMTGRPPFESESAVEILHMHLHSEPVPPSTRLGTEPDPLEAVCMRALAKNPDDRYASALEFRQELIAASSAAAAMSHTLSCGSCGAAMRAEHKFCPACGTPAPAPASGEPAPSARAKGSGLFNLRTDGKGDSTAEVLVRSFPLPLTGRERSYEAARTLLTRPQPQLRARLLQGPPGIGKTRLADEIATLAEQQGWRTYYIGSDPTGARTPLWPIRMMVSQLLELDPTKITTQDLGRVANLSGLAFEELPGLAELFHLQGPAFEIELAVRRRECFASSVQALLSGGRGQPLLLVFDDVDGYDAASREVLRRLVSAPTQMPVIVLATTGETELQWFGGVAERLEPLGPDAIASLGRSVIARIQPSSTLAERLAANAPLSPLSLENHLRLLAAGADPTPNATDGDLVRQRLALVSPTARRVLEAAAVIGERMTDETLRAMEPETNEGVLAELHIDGLLIPVGHGDERAFGHRLFYDVVYSDIEEPRRQSLHRQAADKSRMADLAVVGRTLHLVRSNSPDAIERLAESAHYSERCFDDQSAADLVNAALRLCAAQPSSARAGLEADLALLASRTMRSPDQSNSAVSMLEGELEKPHAPSDMAKMHSALAEQLSRAGRYAEAITALKRGLGAALAGGEPGVILDAYHELGKIYAAKGELDRALSELREGLDMVTLGEGPRAAVEFSMWRYLLKVAEIHRAVGNLGDARQWIEHALFQSERLGSRLGLLRSHAQMAWVLRDLKQLALAEQHLARALDEARHYGDRLTTAELLIERARARASRGRLAEARRCCEEALRLAQGIQWAVGVEHAERAIAMLDRKSPPSRAAGPSENSGAYPRPTR